MYNQIYMVQKYRVSKIYFVDVGIYNKYSYTYHCLDYKTTKKIKNTRKVTCGNLILKVLFGLLIQSDEFR